MCVCRSIIKLYLIVICACAPVQGRTGSASVYEYMSDRLVCVQCSCILKALNRRLFSSTPTHKHPFPGPINDDGSAHIKYSTPKKNFSSVREGKLVLVLVVVGGVCMCVWGEGKGARGSRMERFEIGDCGKIGGKKPI